MKSPLAAALTLLLLSTAAPSPADDALVVRVRPRLAAGVRSTADAFSRATGVAVRIEEGAASPAPSVDVIVAWSDELVRLIEGHKTTPVEDVPLGATPSGERFSAVVLSTAPHRSAALAFYEFLSSAAAHETPAGEAAAQSRGAQAQATPRRTFRYAKATPDSWVPACSLENNDNSDANEVLGAPNAVKLSDDDYLGFMSLGQGGYVTVDMGETVDNHDGAEFRVYQTTTGEPVSVYASTNAAGPWTLLAFRKPCRTPPAQGEGILSNHCDFDLVDTGLSSARYLKIEDGELYPCLAGGTATEGADIDAIEILD
jgi:hypothetical protein